MAKLAYIVFSSYIFSTPFLKIYSYPSPPRQQSSSFGLPPPTSLVSNCHLFCLLPLPSHSWHNMWTAPNAHVHVFVYVVWVVIQRPTKLTIKIMWRDRYLRLQCLQLFSQPSDRCIATLEITFNVINFFTWPQAENYSITKMVDQCRY